MIHQGLLSWAWVGGLVVLSACAVQPCPKSAAAAAPQAPASARAPLTAAPPAESSSAEQLRYHPGPPPCFHDALTPTSDVLVVDYEEAEHYVQVGYFILDSPDPREPPPTGVLDRLREAAKAVGCAAITVQQHTFESDDPRDPGATLVGVLPEYIGRCLVHSESCAK